LEDDDMLPPTHATEGQLISAAWDDAFFSDPENPIQVSLEAAEKLCDLMGLHIGVHSVREYLYHSMNLAWCRRELGIDPDDDDTGDGVTWRAANIMRFFVWLSCPSVTITEGQMQKWMREALA
jgi:hypothetical protein